MTKMLLYSFISCLLFLSFTGCTDNSGEKLDSWLGDYNYTEQLKFSFDGQAAPIEWSLSVNKINKIYKAILNVRSDQTGFSISCDLSGDTHDLFVKYESALSGKFKNLQKGDTLFILSKVSNRIKTKWRNMYSELYSKTATECNCFIYAGTNKNNNTIIVQ
jgi:hypothetical protein